MHLAALPYALTPPEKKKKTATMTPTTINQERASLSREEWAKKAMMCAA